MVLTELLFTDERKLKRNTIPIINSGNNKVINKNVLFVILFKYSLVAISEKCSILVVFNRVYEYIVYTWNNFFKMNHFSVLI